MRIPERYVWPVAAGLAAVLSPLSAQSVEDFRRMDLELLDGPPNAFSVGTRFIGRVNVTFGNLGTIATAHAATDTTSEVDRTYDDGYVSVDGRTDADGNDLTDDGRTNTWKYNSSSQVTEDQSGISFHQYSSISEGASKSVEVSGLGGIDVEYSLRLGKAGRMALDRPSRFSWGFTVGMGLSAFNAKTSGTITATLRTLTDTYSLLGSAVPDVGDGDDDSDDDIDDNDGVGYTSPSTRTETVTNADGTTTEYTVNTTTLLANRPESRLEELIAGGAEIEGFWQVKGASMTLRTGPWFRWQPAEKFSMRVSAGGTLTLLGVRMRYDERLISANGQVLSDTTEDLIQDADETENEAYTVGGIFSGLDAEWWMTPRTGFFGSAYYEKFSHEGTITAGDRSAQVGVESGLGVRFGITTRF